MKKRLSAAFLALGIILSEALPVYAATYTEDGSATAIVTAELESTYQVMLPAAISLTDPDKDREYTGSYKVGAKGNFVATKKIVLAPTSGTFTMTSTQGDSTSAAVTQDIYEWVTASPNAHQKLVSVIEEGGTYDGYSTAEGEISAMIVKAGAYSGNLEFTFSLSDI